MPISLLVALDSDPIQVALPIVEGPSPYCPMLQFDHNGFWTHHIERSNMWHNHRLGLHHEIQPDDQLGIVHRHAREVKLSLPTLELHRGVPCHPAYVLGE
ncbi:hypothetical protein RND81_01G160300 [Saponaria officinalis]|uniref:Uncharacterized protein n=1 Tax=Saponaria officinalis TaxID=3572 RepID=A0AAW1NEM6_SAPOF